jgi:hypothetical protein
MDLVYVIIFLIVLLTINSFLSPTVAKELFTVDDSLPLLAFRRWGRNLVFPYHGSNTVFTASQRAIIDSSLTSTPNGKCGVSTIYGRQLNDSFAIIHEDGIFYTLKKSCIALNMVRYRFENNGNTLVLSLALDTKENIENLSRFLLTDPLFVEFSFGPFVSLAYIPNTGRQFTFSNALNYNLPNVFNTDQTIDIRFDVAVHYNQGDCDRAFNYRSYSPNQYFVTEQKMRSIGDGLIHMWVYYTDELATNFQKTGRDLPPFAIQPYGPNRMTLFDKDFKNLANDPYQVERYEFMNMFAVMYHNYLTPVLTFTFNMVCDTDMRAWVNWGSFQLIKAYVDTNYMGGNSPCANNIMQITLTGQSDYFELALTVGDNGDCGYNTYFAPPVFLKLPYLSPNTELSVTVTIGHNQKHMYVQWTDINSGDIGKKFAYAKASQPFGNSPFDACQYMDPDRYRETNHMTRLFSSKNFGNRFPLGSAYVEWDRSFVRNEISASLGYKNYNKTYAKN